MAGLHHAVEGIRERGGAEGGLRELVAGCGGAVAADERGVECAEREEGEDGRQHGAGDATRAAGEPGKTGKVHLRLGVRG